MRIIQIATAQDGVCYVVECDEDGAVTMFEDGDKCSDADDRGEFVSMKDARDEANRLASDVLAWRTEAHPTTKTT